MKEFKSTQHWRLVFFMLMTSCLNIGYSQKESSEYLVVTYEAKVKKGLHGSRSYHWMIQLDSVEQNLKYLYPLYLYEDFAKNQFDNCLNGDKTYVLTSTSADRFDFNEDYINDLEKFDDLISKNRKLYQTLQKKWSLSNLKEDVNIYVTPIRGTFCKSSLYSDDAELLGLDQIKVYMPVGNFFLNNEFWESNFEHIDFNIKRISTSRIR
jgi:hypothetical protein